MTRANFQFSGRPTVTVRGILSGGNASVTRTYVFFNNSGIDGLETAMHCHRLAVLAMSKPGKFQFGIAPNQATTDSGCRLTLITP